MSLAILCAGIMLGFAATGLLHWWVLNYIFTIPGDR